MPRVLFTIDNVDSASKRYTFRSGYVGASTQVGGGGKKSCTYKPTAKDRKTLKRWKRGESIGFTLTASLKAKGLIPRTSKAAKGKKMVSTNKCQHLVLARPTRRSRVVTRKCKRS